MAAYRLTGKLEGGELAELYRGERDAESVVVKLFHERTSVKAYAQEVAETANRLNAVTHPGIARVTDVGLVKRRLAVVRQDSGRFTLGQVLQRLNTKEVVITPGLAMALVVDLLDAVSEAHAAGVLHGAMTPGNVLVSAEGRPSVCDFGALSALNAVPALKKNFAARGRSSYRAPELHKGETLTVQCDVYSLGAMTYELLTLREATSEGAQMSTRREALPPPSRLDRRLNSRLDPVILRALDPVPGRRYKSSGEFSAALREFLTTNGGLPGRDELKRFVDQLFPKDLQFEPSREVPFEGAFTLASVEGADIEAPDEHSVVLTPRASFSSQLGEMTDLQREEITGPNEAAGPPAPDWHAPAGPMPQTARSGPKESINPDVLKRVKRIEDFDGVGSTPDHTQPNAARLSTEDALPRVFPGRREPVPTDHDVPKVHTPLDTAPASAENPLPRLNTEERAVQRAARARQRWVPIVAGSAFAALAFLALGTWRWSSGMAVQPYEPPGERQRPPPPKKTAPPPTSAKVDPPGPRGPIVDDCYSGPKRGAQVGFLSVSSERPVVTVIDGDTVCGNSPKVLIAAGTRKVVVIDVRTKEEYVSTAHIEPNKVFKLVPIFKGK
ncbi:MAG: serine/threonine protein kinase [Archangiaceae bacterium]|nr:serine/threonine protein kinase [Archangiaceae bacterium]